MYSSYSDTQGELQNFDSCNSLDKREYRSFVFLVDSMHQSNVHESFQFHLYIQEHDNIHFHSENDDEIVFEFYMHYDNDNNFIFPNKVIESADVLGETKENKNCSLPHDNVNDNQIFDKGKCFC